MVGGAGEDLLGHQGGIGALCADEGWAGGSEMGVGVIRSSKPIFPREAKEGGANLHHVRKK